MLARLLRFIQFALALLLVLVAPLLGLLAAAIGTWHAIVAGSIFYLPLGLVIVLMVLAIIQCHKTGDIALLTVMVAGAVTWFLAGGQTQTRLLEWVESLVGRTELLAGLLVLMVMWLVMLYTFRLVPARATRLKLALAGTPLILLLSISTSGASIIYLN